MPASTLISVRGTAELEVAPDAALLRLVVVTSGTEPGAVLAEAAAQSGRTTATLRALGAVDAVPGERPGLTIAQSSVMVSKDRRWNPATGVEEETGNVRAHATLVLTARDFGLSEGILRAVGSAGGAVSLDSVAWLTDEDNPGWAEVRRLAVADAVRQAHDYAGAVGARIDSLDHLADSGLLTGQGAMAQGHRASAMAKGGAVASPGEVPRLDPEVQVLHAAVEARFTAIGAIVLRGDN